MTTAPDTAPDAAGDTAGDTVPEPRPVQARRPPAPPDDLAIVTRLSPHRADTEVVPVAAVVGALALDTPAPVPTAPVTPELRVLRGNGPGEHRDVQAWAARFAQATVEVLGGDRPLPQLLRWTNARVYHDLDRRVRILARSAPAPERRRTIRPQVRSVHVYLPDPGCAEVSVHVRHGHRSRAIAARLERNDGRWTCVALQLG